MTHLDACLRKNDQEIVCYPGGSTLSQPTSRLVTQSPCRLITYFPIHFHP